MQILTKKVALIHIYYFAALAILAVIYDAWKLIPPQALLDRWQIALLLLVVSVAVWFTAHQAKKQNIYQFLIAGLVLTDIIVAAASVYQQRGVASLSVALFIIPLLVVTLLKNTAALYTAATLCAAAYSLAVVKYAVDFPGEGFRIEMYGEIIFWSAIFFIVAWILKLIMTNSQRT